MAKAHPIRLFFTVILAGLLLFIAIITLKQKPLIYKKEPVKLPFIVEEIEAPPEPVLYEYVEVMDGCGPYWGEGCLNVRSGPGEEYPLVMQLRSGVVLRVEEKVHANGRDWYKIVFDEWLRYPERVKGDWYIAAEYVKSFTDVGPLELLLDQEVSTTKRILVDRSEQTLYAYEGDTLFMMEHISTGLILTPTPRGSFRIYKKTPSRYMQGPLPGISEKYYDLPGVPWNLFFTYQGAVIHGAYWHDKFGQVWSSGCVNMLPSQAKELYVWADLGTPVTVRD